MVTKARIIEASAVVCAAEGYDLVNVSTHHNGGRAYTGFLWQLKKGGKNYRLQTSVHLLNVREADMGTYATVFKVDLTRAEEVE